jgi:ribose/xylose/arabinose/galactoside ABC-type transport system permease subunit
VLDLNNKTNSLTLLKVKNFIANNVILFAWGIFFVAAIVFVEGFLTTYNLKSYVINISPLLVAACGLTFITLNGGIDFSMTSVISLVSTISAYMLVKTQLAGSIFAIPVTIFVCIALGAGIGCLNGLAVVKFKMPSFIATLSTMLIFSGIAVWFGSIFYDKISLSGLPEGFTAIGGKGDRWWIVLLIAAVVFLFSHWLLQHTIFGRQLYAVGVNPQTAYISGINVKKIIFYLCLISGIYAAISGLMYTAKNGAGIVSLGDDMFIDIIGSVLIGGTSPAGGRGSIKQTFYGVLFLVLLNNILNLLGVTYTLYNVVKGVFILFAAIFDIITRYINAKSAVLTMKINRQEA